MLSGVHADLSPVSMVTWLVLLRFWNSKVVYTKSIFSEVKYVKIPLYSPPWSLFFSRVSEYFYFSVAHYYMYLFVQTFDLLSILQPVFFWILVPKV